MFQDYSYNKKPLKNTRGFSLVETLVAISILLLALTATLFTTSRGISITRDARNQVIAFYLAQEAAEYVINRRDTNVLSGVNWLSGVAGGPSLTQCLNGSRCTIDVERKRVEGCVGVTHESCQKLYLHNDTGIYNYDTLNGEETIFRRSVVIDEFETDKEATITVTVTWPQRSQEETFTMKSSILNWQQ